MKPHYKYRSFTRARLYVGVRNRIPCFVAPGELWTKRDGAVVLGSAGGLFTLAPLQSRLAYCENRP